MKKIRIIYTIPNFDTCGTGMAMMKLAMNLNKDKFCAIIVTENNKGNRYSMVTESGLEYHTFPYLHNHSNYFSFFIGVFKTAWFFKKLKADIVFSYHYASNISEAISAKLAGSKFGYIKKNMSWHGYSNKFWKIKTYLSSIITVQNTDMMFDFFKNNNKAHIVSLGVDQKEYYPRNFDLKLYKEFFENNFKIILCVANIVEKKGIDFLIDAFALLYSKNTDWRLMIVGDCDNDLGQSLIYKTKQIGLENVVVFTGKRYDVHRFYSIANYFILPSIENEGAPVAIQEAMASGVIVLTTNTPGNRDQLSELPDQIIEPRNSKLIYEKVLELESLNETDKRNIILRQLNIVNERYSLDIEITKHENLYLSLFNN